MVDHRYVWPEYDDYVGVLPVALMLAGAALSLFGRGDAAVRRVRRIDLAVLAVLVWCALGGNRGASLFKLLHVLPVFDSLRVPSRFLGPAMVAFGLLAAAALGAGRRWVAARRPAWATGAAAAAALIAVGVVADLTLTNQRLMQQGVDPPLPDGRARSDFFQNPAASYWRVPAFPVEGYGTSRCYVALTWKPSPWLWLGHNPQAYVQPLAAGTVTPTSWTPNRLEYDVQLNAPAVLVINQNYEAAWRAADSAGDVHVGSFLPGEARLSADRPWEGSWTSATTPLGEAQLRTRTTWTAGRRAAGGDASPDPAPPAARAVAGRRADRARPVAVGGAAAAQVREAVILILWAPLRSRCRREAGSCWSRPDRPRSSPRRCSATSSG